MEAVTDYPTLVEHGLALKDLLNKVHHPLLEIGRSRKAHYLAH